MWRIVLAVALTLPALHGEMVNAIAAVVNGEPITLYEVKQTAQGESISTNEALEMLIDLRLQEARIKELGLSVSDQEVDRRIEQIAQRNSLDTATLRQILRNRGTDWSAYREQIEKALLNEKLAQRVMADEMVPVTQEEIERHYEQNRQDYVWPEQVRVVQYVARNEALLEQAQQNPMAQHPEVSMQAQTLALASLNPRLAAILAQTPKGEFTPIFPVGENRVTLLVRNQEGENPRPLESVEREIAQQLQSQRESRAIENYFARERAKAEITILRRP